jgi:hypothetical protein
LTSVNFPKVTSIWSSAFYDCTGLTSVSFPDATSIGDHTFSNCTGLISVNIPKVTSISSSAFSWGYIYSYTGETAMTITLGSTPPEVGGNMFWNLDVPKTITIRRPSTAEEDYTSTWVSAFKGLGGNASTLNTSNDAGEINDNITVVFADSDPENN